MKPGRMFHGAQVSKNPAPQGGEPGLRRDRHRQVTGTSWRSTRNAAMSRCVRSAPVTRDLEAMVGVAGVVRGDEGRDRESTSVYWIPVYETLERAGFEVMLVPPRMTKQIGGRKSDVLDCQWIWQLMSYGLLRGAFRPGDAVCPLRSYARQMRRADRGPLPLRPAHAKALTEMQRQARLGDRQHHGTDRPAHPARDHRRRA